MGNREILPHAPVALSLSLSRVQEKFSNAVAPLPLTLWPGDVHLSVGFGENRFLMRFDDERFDGESSFE